MKFADEHYLAGEDALVRAEASGLMAEQRTALATIALAHFAAAAVDPRVFEAAMQLREMKDDD
jgi:hypothetical protein